MLNPMNPGYYSENDLRNFGIKQVGRNVRVAKNCTLIGPENVSIGNNVRIDGYCTIVASGEGLLHLGSYIHIGAYCLLSAGSGIDIKDFAGLSHGVQVYSRTDDYSGNSMTNPMVPEEFTDVTRGKVTINRHVIVGASTVILPKCQLAEGCSVGALSLISKSLDPWGVYFGTPAKRLKDRSQNVLQLEQEFLATMQAKAA